MPIRYPEAGPERQLYEGLSPLPCSFIDRFNPDWGLEVRLWRVSAKRCVG